jgi:hypothetical protein
MPNTLRCGNIFLLRMDALRVLLCRIGCYQWDSSTRAHVEHVSGEASEQRTNMIVVLIVTPMSTLFDPSSTTTRIAIGTLRVHRSPNILTIPTRWQVTRNGKPKQGIGSLVFHDCMFEYLKSMHYITLRLLLLQSTYSWASGYLPGSCRRDVRATVSVSSLENSLG